MIYLRSGQCVTCYEIVYHKLLVSWTPKLVVTIAATIMLFFWTDVAIVNAGVAVLVADD